MKRFPSIKKNSDFQNIYRNGKSYANRLLVMYVMRNGEESNRLGISVSKKVGNSVVRHHIARLMREIFRLNNEKIETGLNIIVVARTAAAASDYKHLEGAYTGISIMVQDRFYYVLQEEDIIRNGENLLKNSM